MANYNSAYTGAEIDEYLGFALNGAAKAWLDYDHTVPQIDGSYNISSATDAGTGRLTWDFTNSFSDANWQANTSGGGESGAVITTTSPAGDDKTKATTGWGVRVRVANTNSDTDREAVLVAMHGTLA